MIKYKVGNLMQASERYIAHGCNAQGVMGKGVALSIKQNYPAAYEEYRHQYLKNGLKVGQVITAVIGDKVIFNCITQEHYKKKLEYNKKIFVSYDGIRDVMKVLNTIVGDEDIAMPLIGCGLGGGDWKVISNIIKEEFKDSNAIIYVLSKDELDKYSQLGD